MNPVLGMTGISGERIVTPQERLAALRRNWGSCARDIQIVILMCGVRRMKSRNLKPCLHKGSGGQNARSDGMGETSSQEQIERYVVDQSGGAFNPTYRQFLMQLEEVKAEIEKFEDYED